MNHEGTPAVSDIRVHLSEMSWPEIGAAVKRGAGVVLVVGSLEQHGPHLPTATDLYIPLAVANAVAENLDLMVAAPLTYGYRSMPQTGAGEFFPGTFWLSGPVLEQAVEQIVTQLIRTGFRRILLLSWHWENMRSLWEACITAHEIARAADAKIVLVDNPGQLITTDTTREVFGPSFQGWEVEHAALAETALMQHLRPHLVRSDQIRDDHAAELLPYEVIPASHERAPASGVFATASQATAEKGRTLFTNLVESIEAIARRELEVPSR